MKVTRDGMVALFAKSDLFGCPYGIAFDRAGNLHVVNYNDNRMTKVDPQGAVTLFATVSEKGLAHLCFKKDRFYVTAFWVGVTSQAHQVFWAQRRNRCDPHFFS
jgi:DNA-binding beta-propeller fold protein YncE